MAVRRSCAPLLSPRLAAVRRREGFAGREPTATGERGKEETAGEVVSTVNKDAKEAARSGERKDCQGLAGRRSCRRRCLEPIVGAAKLSPEVEDGTHVAVLGFSGLHTSVRAGIRGIKSRFFHKFHHVYT